MFLLNTPMPNNLKCINPFYFNLHNNYYIESVHFNRFYNDLCNRLYCTFKRIGR